MTMAAPRARGSRARAGSRLPSIDDFAFTGTGDTLLAVQNQLNQADLITPDGTAADGLSTRPRSPCAAVPCT